MAEHRPFPASPRRRQLARQAGLTAASPLVVGAIACAAATVALVVVGRAAAARLGGWIAAAAAGRATLSPGGVAPAVVEIAAPALVVAALAALAVHVAQTRAPWLPRRRIPDAPAVERGGLGRLLPLAGLATLGATAGIWLWLVAPRIARLVELADALPAAGALLASLVATLAIAWLAVGVADALIRRAELARSLAMTAAEKRADDRLAAADPRWQKRRAELARGPAASDAVAGAAFLLLGDGVAVAIAWDPVRRPVPVRTAVGRDARATQLLGLARRHRIPVHRDPAMASALAAEGPVPERDWPRLAEIAAATSSRHTSI